MTHGRRIYAGLTALLVTLALVGSAGCAATTSGAAPETPAAAATPAGPPASTADGAFTGTQAMRGQMVYMENCSVCHLDDLSGSDQAPPLSGDAFLANYTGQDVSALVDRVRNTMPLDNPGILNTSTSTDVVAYILQANGFPAGQQELTAQSIRAIMIKR